MAVLGENEGFYQSGNLPRTTVQGVLRKTISD